MADSDLSMPKASSIRSISALSNSLPRSVWKTSMSEIGKESVANADLTSRASFVFWWRSSCGGTFIFQRRKERLCDGVVVAVAGTAAREAHMVAPGPLSELAAGVLRPLVRVEYGVLCHVPARTRALEGADDDIGGHALGQRPAHEHAGVQVDHRRQVEPALAGAQVGDVADELVGGHRAREVPPDQVGPWLGVPVGDRRPLRLVRRAAADPQLAHALAHTVQRDAAQAVGQEALHEPRAEAPVGLEPHAPHGVARLGPVVDGAAVGNPAAVARPAHPQHLGHHRHREVALLRLHEPVPG